MKYLRSIYEYRLYEIENEYDDPSGTHWYSCLDGTIQLTEAEVVVKSDEIEDLLDEYVLVAPYRFRRPKTTADLDKDIDEMKWFYTDKDDIIYGAIWTKDGLRYVTRWDREQEEWDLL